VGAVLFLGLKILKTQGRVTELRPHSLEEKQNGPSKESTDDKKERENRKVKKDFDESAIKHYCHHHPQDHAAGVCAICQLAYCEECIKEHEGHSFCEDHFRLYLSHDWDELDTIKTNPDIPETALPLYDFKLNLWRDREIPSILSTHYKINIEGDFIESYVKLVVRKEELGQLKQKYEKLKQ